MSSSAKVHHSVELDDNPEQQRLAKNKTKDSNKMIELQAVDEKKQCDLSFVESVEKTAWKTSLDDNFVSIGSC